MTSLLIIAAVAGLVWGALLLARGSLVAGCLTYLVLTSCFGVHFFSFDVAGTTLSIDRLFVVALAGAYLVQWRLGKTDPKPITKTDLVLFGLLGVFVASAITHDWRTTGKGEVPVVQHLINGYFIPLALYWIARQARHNEQSLTLPLAALACFGVYLALIGLLEAGGQWALVFPQYIADSAVGLHFGRSRGPMVQSVSYGLYLATCLMCTWLWREQLRAKWQWLVWLLLPLYPAALFFTKTRSVWLGTAAGFLIVLSLTLRGKLRVTVIGSLVAAALLVSVLGVDSILGLKREGTVEDTHRSTSMRGAFTYVSWEMFQDKPLFGFGFGQFAREKKAYLADRSVDLRLEEIRDYVHHNTFLSVLTETGLVGLSLLVLVLAGWGASAWQLTRDLRGPPSSRRIGVLMLGVLGVAFFQMIGHEITFTTLDHSLIYMLAGLTVGLRAAAKPASHCFKTPTLTCDARTMVPASSSSGTSI